MNKFGFLFFFIMFSFLGSAQEIPRVDELPEGLQIKRTEIIPSLSILAPEVPNTGRFILKPVTFGNDNVRREIDIAAVMEREERMKTRHIELAPPVQVPQLNSTTVRGEETFSITPRFYNQSESPYMQRRGVRNSVYRNAADATGASYLHTYSPFVRGYGYRGYYY